LMPADDSGKLSLKDGHASLRLKPMKKPGFRDLKLTAKIDGQTFRHHVKLGFSPEKIEPFTKKPADFDRFWLKNLEELAKTPLNYTITPAPRYTTDKIDAYLVKLVINKQGQAVYGYLTMPKNAAPGSCPIVMCPPGAGIKTIKEPLRHKYYAENGCIRFEMEIHGLNPEMTEEQFREIAKAFSGKENGYLSNGLDNRDNYYMKRVYLACVRAIDFLTSLPEWDGRNVGVQGGSQGGALAIVTAALDPRVTAVAANHPALSDMAAFKAGRADGYPHFSRIPGSDTPEKLNTMAYYDVVNFARNLRCPVFMTWGYNDDTCPPTTSYAVYNSITSPKEALLTPINEHWTSDATERAIHRWLLSNFK
ncbi:MAG: acetylxylan esterase, partial [Muribaculaceae bacterium]|nr:acetylxylan esterase [Muribaculaceae bacterium]